MNVSCINSCGRNVKFNMVVMADQPDFQYMQVSSREPAHCHVFISQLSQNMERGILDLSSTM